MREMPDSRSMVVARLKARSAVPTTLQHRFVAARKSWESCTEPADLNCDCAVDFQDLLMLLARWS